MPYLDKLVLVHIGLTFQFCPLLNFLRSTIFNNCAAACQGATNSLLVCCGNFGEGTFISRAIGGELPTGSMVRLVNGQNIDGAP